MMGKIIGFLFWLCLCFSGCLMCWGRLKTVCGCFANSGGFSKHIGDEPLRPHVDFAFQAERFVKAQGQPEI